MPKQQQLSLRAYDDADIMQRSMAVRADSVREADYSAEAAVVAGERKVRVFDWARYDVIDEVLMLDRGDLVEGVPLLDSHRRYSFDDVLGHASDWSRTADEIAARAYFDHTDERGLKAWNKVKGRHLRAVSVGYRVLEATDIPPGEQAMVEGRVWEAGRLWLRIATKWRTDELSILAIGADDGAKFRNETNDGERIDHEFASLATDGLLALCERLHVQRADLVGELTAATGLRAAMINRILAGQRGCPDQHRETIAAVLEIVL
jgi:hypothetical protein